MQYHTIGKRELQKIQQAAKISYLNDHLVKRNQIHSAERLTVK